MQAVVDTLDVFFRVGPMRIEAFAHNFSIGGDRSYDNRLGHCNLPENTARFAPLEQLLSHNNWRGHITLGVIIELNEVHQDGNKDFA